MSGSPNSKNFKVIEYEVYKVLWKWKQHDFKANWFTYIKYKNLLVKTSINKNIMEHEEIHPDAKRQAIFQRIMKNTPTILCPSG